jgi:hypothetical protein
MWQQFISLSLDSGKGKHKVQKRLYLLVLQITRVDASGTLQE